AIPTVNNGTLTLATGTGLSGGTTFTANQSGNSTFTVAAASGYIIPTTAQRNNWNTAYDRSISSTSFSGSTGTLSFTRADGSTGLNVNLDGRYLYAAPARDTVDLNDRVESGLFGSGSGAANDNWDYSPYIVARLNDTGWQLQIDRQGNGLAFRGFTHVSGTTYSRSSWKQVWHTGNFTPGDYQQTITGAATTIVSSNLTANRALISNGSGKVAVSDFITTTELDRLNGVTSNIQTQLDGKAPTSHTHTWSQLSGGSTGLIPGAGASGTYGSLSISGSKGSYSGIQFTSVT